ncbi:MAG TPA: hypothetical protein VM282_08155 [Acidimicrobiales bacterium]|nr:hypothetical protein [Acidimicrobiales bacterium]
MAEVDEIPEIFSVQLAEELSIRELQAVDLSDAEAVIRFVTTHGLVNGERGRTTEDMAGFESAYSLEEVIHELSTVKALARHVVCYLNGAPVQDAWLERSLRARLVEKHDWPPDYARGAFDDDTKLWRLFATEMTSFLAWHHVRVDLASDGPAAVGLCEAIAMQAFNLLLEGLPPRRCCDPTCPNWFVRQQGRAQQAQHRTRAVRYCSRSCARRHTQRIRRERNRETR